MSDFPDKLTLTEGYYLTDGGTIVLVGEAPDGARHQITLAQSRFLKVYDPNLLPGRLYFNGQMVPVRSSLEEYIITLLKSSQVIDPPQEPGKPGTPFGDGPVVIVGDDLKEYYAKLAEGQHAVIRHLIEQLVKFVESRKYVRLSKKIGGPDR